MNFWHKQRWNNPGRRARLSVATLAMMSVACPTFSIADENQKALKCTVFHQKDFYAGKLDVIVAPQAVRMNLIDRNSYIVSRAPDWRVVMYNQGTNNGLDMPFAAYLSHVQIWNPVAATSPVELIGEKIGSVRYDGLNCIRYGHLFIRSDGTVDPQNRYSSEIYVVQNNDFPKQACQIVGKFSRDSTLPGIRVFTRVNGEGRKRAVGQNLSSAIGDFYSRSIVLETTSIESKEYPASYFNYPVKINKVKRECDVLNDLSAADKKELFDVLAK